ncbi:DNA adenine methylase [Bacteroidota bacterium]
MKKEAVTYAKPFLKWAGGKSQLLEKLNKLYPYNLKSGTIKKYFEPFVGGGAVFFDIIQKYKVQSAELYDINEELILAYKVIQSDVDKLLDYLYRYQKEYIPLEKSKRKEYYYEMRHHYNLQRFNIDYTNYSESWIPRAAQIIFLNKTCYNGLFRFNSLGEFNVPAGDYKNPKILDEENLKLVSQVLDKTEVLLADFEIITKRFLSSSFVYFDPPYRPISKTAYFTSYNKKNFNDEDQKRLAKIFKFLDNKGVKLMLSNSDPKNIHPSDHFFDDLYSDYNIRRIKAKRAINSVASKRGHIYEIVVTNYE